MPLTARATVTLATVTLATAGLTLASLSAPALARDEPRLVAKGPTNVYDNAYSGVKTRIVVTQEGRRTVVRFRATGFPAGAAGHTFGAHVHQKACGENPAAAGMHYQNPKAPPNSPLRDKEIWLDFTVRQDGTARSRVVHGWHIAKGAAGSVVVHAEPTDAETGGAGPRLLCTTVPF